MRTICLLNAEFNANNQWVGRMMMKMAKEQLLLAVEQYDSRQNHSSITAALNKRLTFNIFLSTKQTRILISNDTSKCYDHIVHSIAMIAMQRIGIPYNITKSLFLPLQQMQHNIATGFGTSDVTYSSIHLTR